MAIVWEILLIIKIGDIIIMYILIIAKSSKEKNKGEGDVHEAHIDCR